jgi:hypothetical protein
VAPTALIVSSTPATYALVVTAEKPPQRTAAGADSLLFQDDQQFHKRSIRLRPHHLQDHHRMPSHVSRLGKEAATM